MASSIFFVSHLLLLLLFIEIVHCGNGEGMGISLIHRDSPDSPLYDPSLSHSDRLRAAAHRSLARARHVGATTTSAKDSSITLQSEVVGVPPHDFTYLMTINVGTPPLKMLAVADTGSDLIWTQCEPCVRCYKHDDPIYNPSNSSTYKTIPCDSSRCLQYFPENRCSGNGSLCRYDVTYGDMFRTEGTLSSETFTFDTIGGETKVVKPGILFGCTYETTEGFPKQSAGLVGLGDSPLSLVSQLGASRFSYILVSSSNGGSMLNIGDKAVLSGSNVVRTPLVEGEGDIDSYYYISLEDISIGNKSVGVKKSKIIIDSGTTYTILDKKIMNKLVDKLSRTVKYPRATRISPLELCFNVPRQALFSRRIKLPELTFRFSGADVTLPPANTFVMFEELGVVCLAMVSRKDGPMIFGNIAQRNWHIGFDLRARMLSFAPSEQTYKLFESAVGIISLGLVMLSVITWSFLFLSRLLRARARARAFAHR